MFRGNAVRFIFFCYSRLSYFELDEPETLNRDSLSIDDVTFDSDL